MKIHRTRNIVVLAALAIAITACGGSRAGSTGTPGPIDETTTTTTEVVAETAAPIPVTTTNAPARSTTITQTPTTTAPQPVATSGVVIAVEGTLQGIDSFTVLLEDGTELTLIPEPDLLFDGGPLSHLRDHLASGSPVGIVYIDVDGTAVAQEVGDA